MDREFLGLSVVFVESEPLELVTAPLEALHPGTVRIGDCLVVPTAGPVDPLGDDDDDDDLDDLQELD